MAGKKSEEPSLPIEVDSRVVPNKATPQTLIGEVPMLSAYVFRRVKDGWVIHLLNLPEQVVRAHTIKVEGPHPAELAAAKMEESFLKRVYSTGK